MYIYTHPSIHPSMHACMHTCIHAYMHTYIHAYGHFGSSARGSSFSPASLRLRQVPAMSSTGTVKSFNPVKGFGFVAAADGTDLFVHIRSCVDGMIPQAGDTLTYDVEQSQMKAGQMQAGNVRGGTAASAGKVYV